MSGLIFSSQRIFILLAVTALVQSTLSAQDTNIVIDQDDIIIDQDAGETLELKAINVLAQPIKPCVHGALTIGAGADVQNTLKDDGGYAKATRESLLVGLDVPLADKTVISGTIEREFSQYSFDLNPPSISEIGFMHLSITRFGLIARHQLGERWSLFAVGIIIDRRIPLVTAITYQLRRGTFIKCSVATPFYRQYKFCASDGTTVESLDLNYYPSFNLSAGALF